MTLGVGTLTRSAGGLLEGEAQFDVRGAFPMSLSRPIKGADGIWMATFRVGTQQCAILRVPKSPPGVIDEFPDGSPEHWHGYVSVTGYTHKVRIEPGEAEWIVTFLDCPQREIVDWIARMENADVRPDASENSEMEASPKKRATRVLRRANRGDDNP